MLIKAKTLTGFHLEATDGEIGKVQEFYFDDRHWAIRYLVAETGGWLKERSVLISPYSLRNIDSEKETISVDLNQQQIKDSPAPNSDRPISRRDEKELSVFYGWPPYWSGPFMWGAFPYILKTEDSMVSQEDTPDEPDFHLHSTDDVRGSVIEATDGDIGSLNSFIIDDKTWAIRYIVVDTGNWWPGKMVLISPRWISGLSWLDKKVSVQMSREKIQHAPEYTDDFLITRNFETTLFGYYDLDGYWVEEELDDPVSVR